MLIIIIIIIIIIHNYYSYNQKLYPCLGPRMKEEPTHPIDLSDPSRSDQQPAHLQLQEQQEQLHQEDDASILKAGLLPQV